MKDTVLFHNESFRSYSLDHFQFKIDEDLLMLSATNQRSFILSYHQPPFDFFYYVEGFLYFYINLSKYTKIRETAQICFKYARINYSTPVEFS